MVAGMLGSNIGRQPPGAVIFLRSAQHHSGGNDCHQSSSSFLVADTQVLSPVPAGSSSHVGALPSSLANTLGAPAFARCSQSRQHNARIGASFLGLSADTHREQVCQQADALLPQSLNISPSSTRMSSRLLGTCFLDMDHAPASSPELASSLFHNHLDHVHSSSPEFASSFFHHFTQDPEVATDRAAAAAEHAENDSAFALHKALGVTKIADAAILYCYSAVFVAMAMAALGVANGAIDWYAAKRDQGDVEDVEETLASSGWPEYQRRRQSGRPAEQAGEQPGSASSGNEPRRSTQQPGRPAIG